MKAKPMVDVALAATMGLSKQEWELAVQTLGRTPSYEELGVISVMWSEHCSYKSSRVHLKRLPTAGEQVVLGPGENAGAIDIGDGYCAVFKMESHNHPSFIEPYQGAATGVGGILRDVFTMGARPIALLNSLRFGQADHPKTARLLRGVVAGIGGYGNCIGVPTVGGEVQFDASYNGNILVNAFALGIAKKDELFLGRAEGVGNPVLYVGSKTGRDGIHGATMASAEFDEKSEQKLPTVQVGDPFMEKLLLEACLEIFATGAVAGVQDMGAAGLTSSAVEMASRAGSGIELNLDLVPRRAKALSAYEMLLSESQERMLMVAHAGKEGQIIEVCRKWDLDVAVIGTVTDSGHFVCRITHGYDPLEDDAVRAAGDEVVNLPLFMLTEQAPVYDRPQQPVIPSSATYVEQFEERNLQQTLPKLLASPNICSRSWIYRQYDHIVRVGTVVRPGQGDAAVVRAFCDDNDRAKDKLLALAVDCNGRYVKLDPKQGAARAVAECCRNIACVGGMPLGLTDCLNFGSPEQPETMWRFAEAVDGIADACRALGIAVVSGNVSLYNETDGQPILPTPTVAVVGTIEDISHVTQQGFKRQGDIVIHLGTIPSGDLRGSEWSYLQGRGDIGAGLMPIDLGMEKRLQSTLRELIKQGFVQSAHDVSEGGLAVCVAESCITGNVGAQITRPSSWPAATWLSEEPSRVLISASAEHVAAIKERTVKAGIPTEVLGTVGGDTLSVGEELNWRLKDLHEAYQNTMQRIAEQ